MGANDEFPWDDFDSSAYVKHNYLTLRDDDASILRAVAEHFASVGARPGARGVDVGSGANLYPALSMLPFCESIDLWEHSAANVAWLANEIRSYSANWDPFWRLLTDAAPAYDAVERPRPLLARRSRPVQGTIFGLPAAQWDMGTMFFVAESLTAIPSEFEAATRRFVRALRDDAPFAAAFMEHSEGYRVGDQRFPAVSVGVEDVRACLADDTRELKVQRFDSVGLRPGYGGMILATGRSAVG